MRMKIGKNAVSALVLAGLLLCGNVRAQIFLHDGSTNFVTTGSSPISGNFTVTAGAGVLVVSLFDRNGEAGNLSPASLTWTAPGYGAQTLTRAVSENNDASTYADSDIYYLFNPNPGTANITATDTSGGSVSAMTMQVYTLAGVNTALTPVTYAANAQITGSLPVTLSNSTPANAWAVVNCSFGNGGDDLYVSSTSGEVNCPYIDNVTEQSMGYVANLSGSSTITASVSSSTEKMALAVAVFAEQVGAPPTAPATPTNLVAAAQTNQVALSWQDASSGAATNYTVLRSTTSGVDYLAIATNTSNTATNYTDTGVTNWTTYYYVVNASDGGGTSAYSAQASATPVGLAATPTGLAATPGDAQVVLTWNAENGATNFNVLRSTTSGSGFTTIASVTATNYTDTAVANNTTYYYEVNATNRFGTSPNSAQVSATPMIVVPNAHIGIDAGNAIRTADTRWFGINLTVDCPDVNLRDGVPEMGHAGWTTLRFPGGSISDNYDWEIPNDVSSDDDWTNFANVATNMGATVFITVNYGTGTPALAAAWVANANVTNHYGFKYWEIGNEMWGDSDSNLYPNQPHCYATNAAAFIQQMKAVDPAIKCGVCVKANTTDDSDNDTSHPATNLVTGAIAYGWTPVVLSTLSQAGVTPDFLVFHWYDASAGSENDATLLASTTNVVADAAELRGQITGYFGPGGTNIELVITEHNTGTQAKQSVSLVNALYYADSLGQIVQTEFNAEVWWDYTDSGPVTTGNLSTNLYGWRIYGDYGTMMPGIAEPFTNRYPQYFAAELMSHFIRAGDKVVSATSDNPLVSAYAALRTNGSLTLMTINKHSSSNLLANIVLTNYIPAGTAALYSYGMPNDNAAETANNNCDISTNSYGVGTNFNYTLPPYSVSVLAFTPAPTPVQIGGVGVNGNQFIFSYPTVSGLSYQLEYNTNLTSGAWLAAGSPVVGSGGTIWASNSIGSLIPMFFRLSITNTP